MVYIKNVSFDGLKKAGRGEGGCEDNGSLKPWTLGRGEATPYSGYQYTKLPFSGPEAEATHLGAEIRVCVQFVQERLYQ